MRVSDVLHQGYSGSISVCLPAVGRRLRWVRWPAPCSEQTASAVVGMTRSQHRPVICYDSEYTCLRRRLLLEPVAPSWARLMPLPLQTHMRKQDLKIAEHSRGAERARVCQCIINTAHRYGLPSPLVAGARAGAGGGSVLGSCNSGSAVKI